MTPDEVIEKLKDKKISLTRRTLLNYEKWGLVESPERGGGGTGGLWTNYSPKTIYEAYAAFKLMHGKYSKEIAVPKIPPKTIAIVRKMYHGELVNINDYDIALTFIGLAGIYESLFRELETIDHDILKEG